MIASQAIVYLVIKRLEHLGCISQLLHSIGRKMLRRYNWYVRMLFKTIELHGTKFKFLQKGDLCPWCGQDLLERHGLLIWHFLMVFCVVLFIPYLQANIFAFLSAWGSFTYNRNEKQTPPRMWVHFVLVAGDQWMFSHCLRSSEPDAPMWNYTFNYSRV